MKAKRYKAGVMSNREVLALFRDGTYRADLSTGVIYGRSGKPLKTYLNGTPEGEGLYSFIALYNAETGKRKDIAVHRVVWMVGANAVIPRNFEVHHEDGDTNNNTFDNLFCLHKRDHGKVHGNWTAEEFDDEVPF